MAVSGQIGSIQPLGIKKKKRRFAPMIQEQARQGIATQMVVGRKQKEQQEEEKGFREEQLGIQKEQATAAQTQWQKDYALRQEEIEQQKERFATEKAQFGVQQQQWQSEMESRKKKQQYDMILGGAGLATNLIGSYFDLF